MMIDELNSKWGLDLSHEVSLYRPVITSEPERLDLIDEVTERVVMVGGSHSSLMTDELDETCLEVMDISVRGWRLSGHGGGKSQGAVGHCLHNR
jgi:hypothetical protein